MRIPVRAPVSRPMAAIAAAERRDLDGTTDYETQNGAQSCPRSCAEQGPKNETAHEPHQTLAGDDAHEAKSAGNGGRDFVLVVQLGCNSCIATF